MSLSTADYLVDRRRLRKQVTFWRVIAFVVAALAIIGLGLRFAVNSGVAGAHIARLSISGMITGDAETVKLIRSVADSKAVAAVLTIDSPGGTTEGSEVLYEEIRRLAGKKPVVAVVGTLAASGAYIAALGADRIFVRGNSIVGSIGVLMQYPNVSGLMDKLGVKLESIKSSPLKAAPNGLEPTSEAARDAMASLIGDSFAWFKGLVKERRQMSEDELARVDDGRVFTGRQGIGLKLVDAIGGEREAIAWLQAEKGVTKDLPVRDWKPDSGFTGLKFTSLAADVAQAAGWSELAGALRRAALNTDVGTDGLLSLWKFSSGE
ncbi:MAG TPA: signal peptide peptidase SppA [Roseiarcus sp.]